MAFRRVSQLGRLCRLWGLCRLFEVQGCGAGIEEAPLRAVDESLTHRQMIAGIGLGHGREGRNLGRIRGRGLLRGAQGSKQKQYEQAVIGSNQYRTLSVMPLIRGPLSWMRNVLWQEIS